MITRMTERLWRVVSDRLLPAPTAQERADIAELRAAFGALPVEHIGDTSPAEAEWLNNANDLRELVLHHDPRRFLRWGVVSNTMFVGDASYVGVELDHLKRLPDWGAVWSEAIRESPVGHPVLCPRYPSSSGNLIHHAYHLARFQEKATLGFRELGAVCEFGGGYGSMCRLFHSLGFRGKYIIYDLPHFTALQRYFLRSLGLPVVTADDFRTADHGIACVSNVQELETALSLGIDASTAAFVATWSLSEAPVRTREAILPLVSGFGLFLFAYQDRFGEVDNTEFFRQWVATHTAVAWDDWRIEHIPGNSYLTGKTIGLQGLVPVRSTPLR